MAVVQHPEIFSEVGGEEEGVQLQCAMCNVQGAMCNVQCAMFKVQGAMCKRNKIGNFSRVQTESEIVKSL